MHLLYKPLTMHVCTINLKYLLGINYPPPTHTHTQYLENVDYFLNADRDQTLENYSPQW